MNNSYHEYLNFANKLADSASVTSMQYFRTSLDIDNKSDQSPVTIADNPLECVAIGTGKALENEELFSTMLSEY